MTSTEPLCCYWEDILSSRKVLLTGVCIIRHSHAVGVGVAVNLTKLFVAVSLRWFAPKENLHFLLWEVLSVSCCQHLSYLSRYADHAAVFAI